MGSKIATLHGIFEILIDGIVVLGLLLVITKLITMFDVYTIVKKSDWEAFQKTAPPIQEKFVEK